MWVVLASVGAESIILIEGIEISSGRFIYFDCVYECIHMPRDEKGSKDSHVVRT